MKITKERFHELGLGCSEEDRANCFFWEDCNGCEPYEISPCVDEDRLREEMTEEEFDAFESDMLEVII